MNFNRRLNNSISERLLIFGSEHFFVRCDLQCIATQIMCFDARFKLSVTSLINWYRHIISYMRRMSGADEGLTDDTSRATAKSGRGGVGVDGA